MLLAGTSQPIDVDGLRFVGEFSQSSSDPNTYDATGAVEVGFTPIGAEVFLALLEINIDPAGTMSLTTSPGSGAFTVSDVTFLSLAPSTADPTPLWRQPGTSVFTIGALTGAGTPFTGGVPQQFPVSGLSLAPGSIQLENPSSTTTSDSQLVLSGVLTIPALEEFTLDISGLSTVTCDAHTVTLGNFSTNLTQGFSLLGVPMTPGATAQLAYTGDDETASLWGDFLLSTNDGGVHLLEVAMGDATSPGITVTAGDLSAAMGTVTSSSTEFFGLTMNKLELSLAFQPDGETLGIYGALTVDPPDDDDDISGDLGTDETPGLVIVNGSVSSLTISVTAQTFGIGELLFQPTDAQIQYVSGQTFNFTGELSIPELLEAKATLTGDDLQFVDGDYDFNGLSISLEDLYLGVGVLDSLSVNYSKQGDEVDFGVNGKFWLPGLFSVDAGFEFEGSELNNITVTYTSTGAGAIPLGETGAFIVELGLTLNNLEHAHDMQVSGTIGMTYGPKADYTVFGVTAEAVLLKLVGTLTADRNKLIIEADVDVGAYTLGNSTAGLLGEGKLVLDFDWGDKIYSVEIQAGLYDGTFKGEFDATLSTAQDIFVAQGELEVDVPDSVPFIGGDTLGSINFAFVEKWDEARGDSFVAAWAKVNLLIHTFDIGFEYKFDGDFKLISNKQVDSIKNEFQQTAPQSYTYSSTFNVPSGTTHATFFVDWFDPSVEASISILPPGYSDAIPSIEFPTQQQPGFSLVPALDSEHSYGVHAVGAVGALDITLDAGEWIVLLQSKAQLTPYWTSVMGNVTPTIAIGPVESNPTLSPVVVPITASTDTDFAEQTTLALFVDTDASGYNGAPVPGAANIPFSYDTGFAFDWDLKGLAARPYYLYATINDGVNKPVNSAYYGPINPIPPIGGVVTDPIHGNPLTGVRVFLDGDGNGRFDPERDVSSLTNATGNYAFFDLPPLPLGFDTYTVGVIIPPGFQLDQDSQNLVQVSFTGDPVSVDFGLDEFASINGTVFIDVNGNGAFEPGEQPLSGWTIFLDADGDGLFDSGEKSVRSGTTGEYTFYSLDVNTTYTVTRILQPDFYDTVDVASHVAAIGADEFQKVTGLDFGVLPLATISGSVAGRALDGDTLGPQVTPIPGQSVTVRSTDDVIAINAGGGQAGRFSASADLVGGEPDTPTTATIDVLRVVDPAPQAVYQTSYSGNAFAYLIDGLEPNSQYLLRLHFAETQYDGEGQRVMVISVPGPNQTSIYLNVDIFADAGGQNIALIEEVVTTTDDEGGLNIGLQGIAGLAITNGLELMLLRPGEAVNAGGSTEGAYLTDQGSSGGQTQPVSTAPIDTHLVANPAPEEVYQTARYGQSFTYVLDGLVADAPYTVRLHFAETYWTKSGQRQFDVAINEQTVLKRFDTVATAGGQNTAIALAFPATADATGAITLEFTADVDNAQINGIEIIGNIATATTDTLGNYAFPGLYGGGYTVSSIPPAGWRQVAPFGSDLALATPSAASNTLFPLAGANPQPTSLATGDFDGDGGVDLAVLDLNNGAVNIFFDGNFSSPLGIDIASDSSPLEIAVGDFIGSGRDDIAILRANGAIDVLENLGQSHLFYMLPGYWTVGFDSEIQIIDMVKGVFLSGATGSLAVLYSQESPDQSQTTIFVDTLWSYPAETANQLTTQVAQGPADALLAASIAAGDFNGDGIDDTVVGFDDVSPMLGFAEVASYLSITALPPGPLVLAGDVNADGRLDLGIFDPSGLFHYATQDALGNFHAMATSVVLPNGELPSAVMDDVNGDFLPDLVWVSQSEGINSLNVALNTESPAAYFSNSQVTTWPVASIPQGSVHVMLADVDHDGLLDPVVSDALGGVIEIALNRSSTAPAAIPVALLGADSVANNFQFVDAGQIIGRVFDDVARDGVDRLTKPAREQRIVYLDLNQNRRRDTGEPTALSGRDGYFAFGGLPDGTYDVRIEPEPGRRVTYPAGGFHRLVVSAGRASIPSADFGSIVALDVVITIPESGGTGDYSIVRSGNYLQVLDSYVGVIGGYPIADVQSVTINSAKSRPSSLRVDVASGGAFSVPGGIKFVGRSLDTALQIQLGESADRIEVTTKTALINSKLYVIWSPMKSVSINSGGGDDLFLVTGFNTSPRSILQLVGGRGDDIYDLATSNFRIAIVDGEGDNTLDFRRMKTKPNERPKVDLALNAGQWQTIDKRKNKLSLTGIIAHLLGAEEVFGTPAEN